MVSHQRVSPLLLLLVACGTPPPAMPVDTVVVSPGDSSASPEPPITARVMHLEVYEVDERFDPFLDLAAAPQVVMFERERGTHYAEVSLRHGETMDEAKERLVQYTRNIRLPDGRFFAFQKSRRGCVSGCGWRTYVLKDSPVLTDANVRAAHLTRDERTPEQATLRLKFDDEGTQALAETHVGGRIAFVVDGLVQVAPIVVSRNDGGEAGVWLGDLPVSEIPLKFASGVPIQKR